MTATVSAVTKAALQLPLADRAAVLLSIFDSLPDASSCAEDILDEAMRRDAEIESGLVREMSHEEFIAGLRLPKVI
jgi:hypothetical protein